MKKKILSVILACCMTLTMMTPMVYAEETTEVTAEEQENDSTEEVIQDEPVEEVEVEDEEQNYEASEEDIQDAQSEDEGITNEEDENDIESFSDEVEDTEETGIAVQSTDLPSEIYLTQQGSSTCTLAASAMMLRARFYKSNNSSWRSITESSIRSTAWVDGTGLRHSWTYKIDNNSVSVNHSSVSGISISSLKSLLNNHPEGIVLYCGKLPHAVFLTDYDGDTFYCADPLSSYSGKRLALSSSYLGKKYGSQASILSNVTAYWYVSSYSIASNGTNPDTCNCSTAYAGNYTCTTSSQNLTIRSGHGSSYSKVGSIPSGATVYVSKASGTGAGDWAHVEYNGVSGFASMEYLKKQDTGHDPFGVLDSATGGIHSVTIRGWALDEDDYGTALEVHIYLDDTAVWATIADKYRPDVNNVYGCGDYHGYETTFSVDSSITGEHTVRAYAINTGGGSNNTMIGSATVNIEKDTENPVISDFKVTDITTTGYHVSCTVTDNVGVDRVQFPTWTQKDGQDDIIPDWITNSAASGARNGDTYVYQVNIADHNNENGLYNTHIYAYDKDGNCSVATLNSIEIATMPAVSEQFKDDFYAKIQNATTGTVLTRVDGEETKDVKFSEDTNAREQIWHFVKNGGSDSYTISCEDDEAMALDVYSGTDEDKANVWVWTKNGSKAQQWTILDNDGNYCLKPGCSELRVLDTPGGSGGTQNAQIYSYNSGAGIKMNIVEVEPTEMKLQNENLVSSGNYNQHRYEIFDQEMTWSDAERACEAAGGHLVSITDAEEQKFVESLLDKAAMSHYWIGMYRNKNTYTWITGESNDYTNWNTGEPNGISSEQAKEYCGEMLNTSGSKGLWNDLSNSPQEKVGVICEYDSVKSYTLTYDANGGTNAPEKKTDEQDAILKVSEDTPIRRGYRFLGWSTDKDAEKAEYQANDEIKLTKDITLYAVWEKMDATGTCGEKVSWELDQQGVLTIYGEGAMKNYAYKSEMPWYKYLSKIQKVVIEKGVTTIGDYAFYGMTDTTEITIPEGVTTIGEYAFKNSTKIAEVTLPSTLKKLGQSAFYGCTSLSKIAIPEGLYTIWGYTFKNCTSLAEVTLPSTLIKIDEAAFYGCSSLKKIEIPEDVSIIGIYCFKNCSNLSEISLPESITKIREAAFYGTAITEITIPDSVTAIGSYAFKNCVKLKKVNLSKELKTIEESAFYACESMTKLILPSNVTTIGDYAFRRCVSLQVVEFSDSLKKIGESAFYGCSDLSELVLPEGMTELGAYAFKSCTNVTSVSLPSTLNVIGESGFYGCDRIESIEIPAAVNTIGNYAFSRCTGLNTVTFKGDAPSIADYTFAKVKATVYYPGDNETWTQDKMKNYGGTLTWKKN